MSRRRTSYTLVAPGSWDDISEDWDAVGYMLEFWDLAVGHAVATYGGVAGPEEIPSIAGHTLATFTDDWFAGRCVEPDALQDRRLFWHWYKERLRYAMHPPLASPYRLTSVDAVTDEDADWWTNRLVIADPDGRGGWSNYLHARITNRSDTNMQLVRTMMLMRPSARAVLALTFFEEMAAHEAADILALNASQMGVAKSISARKLLDGALGLVKDAGPESVEIRDHLQSWKPPAEMKAWLRDRYGHEDLEAYLDWVAVMWALDASYMIDVLWHAHGIHKHVARRDAMVVDPNLVRELTEARYSAGLTQTQACRALASHGVHLTQRMLSSFERMQTGMPGAKIAALRELYEQTEPPAKRPGGGRAPRRWGNNY